MPRKKDPNPTARQLLLLGTLTNGKRLNGREIGDAFEKRARRELAVGVLYTTLDRLEQQGFLKSKTIEPDPEKGGNRRRVFWLTAFGETTLDRFNTAWAGVMA